jgi:hypothetical protein
MALHLVKLLSGVASAADLRGRIAAAGSPGTVPIVTRNTPTRAAEVLDGGSMYWVMRGRVCARQEIRGIGPVVGPDGVARCMIALSAEVVDVESRQRRMFQGWRYLAPEEAPPDLSGAGADLAAMPDDMRRELSALGLL